MSALLPMTHAELVERAQRWLAGVGCSFVVTEFVTSGMEIPDAMGWRNTTTILVECKTSRSDFLADRHKWFRQMPEKGMGRFRYFMCEPGVIKPDELPPRWGLLYVGKKIVTVEAGKNLRYYPGNDYAEFSFDPRNEHAETSVLLSALRRLSMSLGVEEFRRRVHQTHKEIRREQPAVEA